MRDLSLIFLALQMAFMTGVSTQIISLAQNGEKQENTGPSIGVATMKDDGTIVLRLRAKSPHGGVGEGTLVYPPTHPDYQNIISHIGPIRKGQTVSVKPWPD